MPDSPMPRAEIPEGVERFRHIPDLHDKPHARLVPDDEGPWLRVSDLPALHAHWLEQLKEDALEETVLDEVEDAYKESPVGGRQALERAVNALLASIPIEEGSDE